MTPQAYPEKSSSKIFTKGNKYLILILVGMLVLVLPFLGAKNFIIRNASNSNQSYFIVNGTDGTVTADQVNFGNVTIGGDLSAVDFNVSNNLNLGEGTIWYNSTDNKYYYYNTSTWLIFDTEREQNATLMGLHNPDYDSDWFEVTSSETILNHGLNTEDTLVVLEQNESSLELRSDTDMVLLMHMNGTDGYNTDGASDALGRHTFNFEGDAHINTSISKFGGSALKLDGVDDYLNLSTSADWGFGTGDFAIELWFQRAGAGSHSSEEYLLSNREATTATRWTILYDSITSYIHILKAGGTGGYARMSMNLSTDIEWHHLVISREGSDFKIYFDGVSQTLIADTIGDSELGDPTNSLFVGIMAPDNLRPWNGSIDEIAIYKGRALSADEVMSHFERTRSVYLTEKNSSSIKLINDDFVSTARVKMWKEGAMEGNYSGNLVASGNFSLASKITFALGAVIDNLADGWVRVTGALNITGNLSIGGKLLSNNNGTLTWGGVNVESTNVSVMYGTNSSGDVNVLKTNDQGILKLSVTSLKSDVWDSSSGVTELATGTDVSIGEDLNVSGNFISVGNGVGIGSDVSKDSDYTLVSADRNRLVILNGSAGGHTNFTLPAGVGGEIYRVLNDAEYKLTIKPTGTDAIWNSGNGYGIDLPDKGTMVELRYSSSRGKWDILQKTGGKVLIEGLVLNLEPIKFNMQDVDSSVQLRIFDNVEKHLGTIINGMTTNVEGSSKFPPSNMQFDGTDEYIVYQDSTDWDIFGTNETGHKTIAMWIYHYIEATNYENYLAQGEDGDNRWSFRRSTSGELEARYEQNNNVHIEGFSGGVINASTWYHVALIFDGSGVGLYLNGTQVDYDGDWNTDTFSSSLYVGRFSYLSQQYFNGTMQDLHISYNNPYNAAPNVGVTDSFTLPAAPFRGVMN